MKRFPIVAIVCFIFLSLNAVGQTTFKGVIKDSKTESPLPYVNIGVVGKDRGTLTDEAGNFAIALEDKYNNDTLRISMLGYKSLSYKVADVKEKILRDSVITLDEDVQQLQEVVVLNRKLKEKVLGNTSTSNLGLTFASDQLGNELGTRIKIKKAPTYIKEFSTNIVANEHDSIKFRLNFYEVKNGMPGESILNKNIIVTCKIKEGKLTVDLSKYNIVVEDDFFVSLEWLEDLDKGGIRFSTGFLGSPTIVKLASQGEWGKLGALSVGFNVTAEY